MFFEPPTKAAILNQSLPSVCNSQFLITFNFPEIFSLIHTQLSHQLRSYLHKSTMFASDGERTESGNQNLPNERWYFAPSWRHAAAKMAAPCLIQRRELRYRFEPAKETHEYVLFNACLFVFPLFVHLRRTCHSERSGAFCRGGELALPAMGILSR